MDQDTLADLFVANDDFSELEQALDVFCPFEAVGMVSQEIRHGRFLSYIFDPNRPHGFGVECLRGLMAAASRSSHQISSNISLLEAHLMNFDGATVHREWRSIDILIEVPGQDLIVAVELKIDASEHSGQLKRYRESVQSEWPEKRHIFLFLTKCGDMPSDDNGDGWVTVELDALAGELGRVANHTGGDADARKMLDSYLAMLRRHHLDNERLEGLAASLWLKHRSALEYLADRRPNAVGDLFQRLVDSSDELAQSIHAQCGEEVIVDYARRAAIYLAIPAWDAVPGFRKAEGFTTSNRLILFEIAKAGSDYFRCYFILGKGDQAARENLFEQLRQGGCDVGKKSKPTKEWNRLASARISLKGIEDAPDLGAWQGKVSTQIREFASKHIPSYTEALLAIES